LTITYDVKIKSTTTLPTQRRWP